MNFKLTTLTEDVDFGESPRWRGDRLWFSDIKARQIKTVDLQGRVEIKFREIEGSPSGLGWLPDGSMVVVSMEKHLVLMEENSALKVLADTSTISRHLLNDMVVDRYGHIFLSNMGFNYEAGEAPCTTAIIGVHPDGSVHRAAEHVFVPNGMAITSDGNTFIVGLCGIPELLAFDLRDDGSLHRRRVYARLPEGCVADGICLDQEGAVWVSSPTTHEFMRVLADGEITHRITTGERHAIACMLGGDERRTLFCMTSAKMSLSESAASLNSRIEIARVDVPGAGLP